MSMNGSTSACSGENASLISRFGLKNDEAYQAALEFYRREGQNLQLTYVQKNQLSALCRQAAFGAFSPDKAPDVGLLNVVGSDRRAAWKHLGDLSRDSSMDGFCQILREACPSEMEVVLSHASQLKQRLAQEEREKAERLEREKAQAEELARRKQEKARIEQLKREHGEALPISSRAHDQTEAGRLIATPQTNSLKSSMTPNGGQASAENLSVKMWSRPEIGDFVAKIDSDTVIVVGRGEAVTVRVPTHSEGSVLVFEFATEHYDLGFGVSFEWPTDSEAKNKAPVVDCLLPLTRYNSHREVIAGSHRYPGPGTYLLKFDNTYSMIRSKTLFYRVFYKP